MLSFFLAKPKLVEVLEKHFPIDDRNAETVKRAARRKEDLPARIVARSAGVIAQYGQIVDKAADDLWNTYSTAQPIEYLEHGDVDPQKDIEALRKVVANLKVAANHAAKVGFYGAKELSQVALEISPGVARFTPGPEEATSEVSEFLAGLAGKIDEARQRIAPNAPSVMSLFSEDAERPAQRAKRRETGAEFLARECAMVFDRLSSDEPKVRTSNGQAYGPFLDFVTDVFHALDVTASPENWARKAANRLKNQ